MSLAVEFREDLHRQCSVITGLATPPSYSLSVKGFWVFVFFLLFNWEGQTVISGNVKEQAEEEEKEETPSQSSKNSWHSQTH